MGIKITNKRDETKINMSDVKSGTVIKYKDPNYDFWESVGILLRDSDDDNDGAIIYDLEDGCYYKDALNYCIEKIYNDVEIIIKN